MGDLELLLDSLRSEAEKKCSNNALRKRLHWAKKQYLDTCEQAVNRGYINKNRGGGGGVILLTNFGADFIDFISTLADAFNGQCGNISLRRELGWRERRYLRIRAHALDIGMIARGKGKGGSVRLVSREEALEEHLELFIGTLRDEFGGHAGNIALRNELEWDEERYWVVRDLALAQDRIVRGRGKGGAVWLLEEEDEHQEQRAPERELYEPALDTIQNNWIGQSNYDDCIAKVTALRGRTWTGGTWTRPDIAVLAVTSYKYPPNRIFEIITFEIKPGDRVSVHGVFEALSHQQFSHRSFVLYCLPQSDEEQELDLESHPEGTRILQTARKYGIGVIVATDVGDWETWYTYLEPEYKPPDPEQSDLFVSTCFDEQDHQLIGDWFV